MNRSILIEIKNLNFSYGLRLIFTNFSLVIKSGDFLHLKGENGIGKSTLLKCIAGLLSPQNGWVQFYSTDRDSKELLDARSSFAYLDADHNGLFLDRSSLWNLQFYRNLNQKSSDSGSFSLADLSSKWGLNPKLLKNITVSKFSTGMKRRLALACLEAQQKKIWILDEPYNGLDQQGAKLLTDSFKAHLANEGVILLSSHVDGLFSSLQPKTIDLEKSFSPKAN